MTENALNDAEVDPGFQQVSTVQNGAGYGRARLS